MNHLTTTKSILVKAYARVSKVAAEARIALMRGVQALEVLWEALKIKKRIIYRKPK